MPVRMAVLGLLLALEATAAKPKLMLQLGHTESVTDADIYEVGKQLRAVTVGKDHTIKIWDARQGSLLSSLKWPLERRPERILASRDGRRALGWPRFGKPAVIDLETGEARLLEVPFRGAPNVVCRSNDRRTVAIQAGKLRVRLYSLPDLKPGLEAPVDTGTISRCRFGTKDRVLALGDRRGFVSWLDLKKKLQPIDRRKIDSLMIDDLDESPKGGLWAIKGRKDMVLWDLKKRQELARFRPGGSLGFVRYTRDGKHLLRSGHGTKALHYLDPMTGKRQFRVEDDLDVSRQKLDTFRWLEWMRRLGEHAVVRRRDDRNVEIWQGDTGQRVASLWGHPSYITSVAFFGDGRHLAIGTRLGTIERWDLMSGTRRPMDWKPQRNAVTAIAFSPDGRWAATGDSKGNVWIRERKTGRVDRKVRGGSRADRLSFLPDSTTLVISAPTKTKMLNVQTGFDLDTPDKARGVRLLTLSPKGPAASRRGKDVIVFDLFGKDEKTVTLRGRPEAIEMAFSPDGRQLLVATKGGGAVRFDPKKGGPIGALKGPPLRSLAWSPKGDLVAAIGPDASVRFWRGDEPGIVAQLLIDEQGEWIAWAGGGAFDASAGGGKYVAWRVGKRLYPVSRFAEKFHVPGLLGELLTGKSKVKTGDIDDFRPPPEVRIVSPAPNATAQDDLATVTVEVADTGGGVGEIRLYHQGRLVENVRDGLGRGKHQRKSFDVLLEPGPNRFVATALSEGRVESRSPAVDVHYGDREQKIRLRLLAVGIDDYQDDSLDLKYATKDATALAEALRQSAGKLFRGGVEANVLLDGKATRKGVLKGLDWLIENTRASDVAVVYFAGHGETVGEEYYFLPQDLKFTNLDALTKGGVSQAELQERIRRIPARKLVVLLDTCKSGAVSLGFATRGLAEKKALSVLGQAAGIYLVAASTSRQLALEDQKLGHGLFTWSLLEGLKGKADFDSDRAVTVRELVTFLESEVARVSREKFSQEQFPVTHGTGRNFPLAVVPPQRR